jgi:hypothetical protein
LSGEEQHADTRNTTHTSKAEGIATETPTTVLASAATEMLEIVRTPTINEFSQKFAKSQRPKHFVEKDKIKIKIGGF